MVKVLQLLRWPNLLMIVFIQYLIRFSFTEAIGMPYVLDHWYYALGVLCSVLLAGGGYIVNDLYDLETDTTNKPNRITIGKGVSEDFAWYLYFGSTIGAAICAYFLALHVGLDNLWLLAPLASLLLYFYALDLKKRPVIGNVIVSLLSAMPVFLVAVFDIIPAASDDNAAQVLQGFYVLSAYASFAFWLTLIREIIKDLEDRKGDLLAGYKTLAILIPEKGLKAILAVLILGAVIPVLWYASDLWQMETQYSAALYLILFVATPMLGLIYLVLKAQEPKAYHRAASFSKLIMLLGILSMPFFTLSLLYQWP